MNPDQDGHSVGSDVGLNCLQRLSAEDKSRGEQSELNNLQQFQGSTSFVDLLCFFLSSVCYVFVGVCLYVLCGHLLGEG